MRWLDHIRDFVIFVIVLVLGVSAALGVVDVITRPWRQ